MPLYDYRCGTHGVFTRLVRLDDYVAPAACPCCAEPAPRVISSPSAVFGLKPHRTRAQEINERSRHEPVVARSESAAGVACMPAGSQTLRAGHTRRPWMIGH